MAKIKKIYKGGVEYEVSGNEIDSVTVDYQEDGGSPDASAQYSDGELAFSLKNMKMKFSELTAADKAEITGPKGDQGDSAIWTGEGEPWSEVKNSKGTSTTEPMSQNATTEYLRDLEVYSEEAVDLANLPIISKGYYIIGPGGSKGEWANNTSKANTSCLIATTPGDRWEVTPGANGRFDVEFLVTDNHSGNSGNDADIVGGVENMLGWQTETTILTTPATATYLYLRKRVNSTGMDELPSSLKKVVLTKDVLDEVAVLETTVEGKADTSDLEALSEAVGEASIYSSNEVDVSELDLIHGGYYIYESNGKWYNNRNNANTSCLYPTTPGTVFKVVANSSSDLGCDVEFLTSDSHESGDMANFATAEMIGFATGTRYLTAPAGTKYLYIRIRRNQSFPADVSPSEVIKIKSVKTIISDIMDGDSDLGNNTDAEKSLLRQAHYGGSYNDAPVTTLGLLHFSDLHGDSYAAEAILNDRARYIDYIDDTLCTGDVVNYYSTPTSSYPQGTEWWLGTGLPEVSLFTQGNHDGWKASMTSEEYDNDPWSSNGKGDDFETYFEPYIEVLGYVMPNGYNVEGSPNYQACFWHKDYADAKVRLIGLDCIHRFDGIVNPTTGAITSPGVFHTDSGNEQELWLIDRLNECLDGSGDSAEGFHVVFCSHYPLDDFEGDNMTWDETTHKWVCNQNDGGGRLIDHKTADVVNFHNYYNTIVNCDAKFSWRNRIFNGSAGNSRWTQYSKGATNNIANIIEAWVGRGGTPVAFLCGHHHSDYMFYPAISNDILVVAINQAGGVRPNNVADKSDVNYGREVANYYAIDTTHHLFKIVRLGMKDNRQLIPTTYLTYNYLSNKIISEG